MLLNFNYYGFLVGLAVIAAIWLWEKRLSQSGVILKKPNFSLFITLVLAIFGARAWHVVTDWQIYSSNWQQILEIWQGGLSILGAIVGLIIGLYFVSKLQKISLKILLDALALSLPFAQAIGRWGNYFNQELYGVSSNLPWSISVAGQKVHPIFLYESLFMLLLGIYLNKKFVVKKMGSGYYFFLYLFAYLIVRFVLDFLRVQKAMFNEWLGINQVIIFLWFVVLLAIFGYQKKYGKKY